MYPPIIYRFEGERLQNGYLAVYFGGHIYFSRYRKKNSATPTQLPRKLGMPPSGTSTKNRQAVGDFLSCAPARNRTSNNGLEVRSYIHLTTGA